MTFYELESKINAYIKEHKIDDARETHWDNYQINSKLQKIIVELLGGEDLFKAYGFEWSYSRENNGFYLKRKQYALWIEYKRTRHIECGHWHNYAYYGLKSVEIYNKNDYKDLQDFIEQDNKIAKEVQEKHESDYAKMFEKVGVNFYKGGFTLKELLSFGDNFRKLSNAEKKEMFDTYNNGKEIWYY